MTTTKPYYDLCIQQLSTYDFSNISTKLIEFGYKTIAINQVIDLDSLEKPKKKKKKGESRLNSDVVPAPINLKSILSENSSLTLLSRLTICFSDQTCIQKVTKSENYNKFDIIAVVPRSSEALKYSCQHFDPDIISFDPTESKLNKFNRRSYNVAIKRNIHFEIMYAPAIYDQTCRKNIINKSHAYHAVGKSKNIIISSSAANLMQIRGPYDIINLGLIFGLSEEQSKHSISTAPRDVLNRALGRKIGKAIVVIKNIEVDISDMEIAESDSDGMMIIEDSEEEPSQKKLKRNKKSANDSDLILLEM